MELLQPFVLVIHLIVAAVVCGLVLLQHGKGADMGAAFGSGSSGSLFGSAGSANFLSRTTAILAAVFFLSSLGLTYLGAFHGKTGDAVQQGVMGDVPATKSVEVPKQAPQTPAPSTAPVPSGDAAPTGSPPKPGEVPK
jgi:preprotein translocase subunit SecG